MNARVLLVCVALPLAVVWGRMVVDGRAALREAASHASVTPETIAALGRAARRLGGPAGPARAELAALARVGVPGAWEELRGAILATRWIFTPDAALLDEANDAIASLHAADGPQRELERARLRDTGEPGRGMALLAILGLGLFVGAVARLLWQGPSKLRWATSALGLLCLALGLWRA